MSLTTIRQEVATALLGVTALDNRVFINRFSGDPLKTLPAAIVTHINTDRDQLTIGDDPTWRHVSELTVDIAVASNDPQTDLDAIAAAAVVAIETPGTRTLNGFAFDAYFSGWTDLFSSDGDIQRGNRTMTLTVHWLTPNVASTPPQKFVAYRYSATASTFTAFDYTIASDANAATFTLPSAVAIVGRVYVLKNLGGGTLTLATVNSETIDGLTSQAIGSYDAIKVQSTNNGWVII
jgi:hypothetical protein